MSDAADYTSRKVSLTFTQAELLVLKSMAGQYGDEQYFDETTKGLRRRIYRACEKVGIQPQHRRIRALGERAPRPLKSDPKSWP